MTSKKNSTGCGRIWRFLLQGVWRAHQRFSGVFPVVNIKKAPALLLFFTISTAAAAGADKSGERTLGAVRADAVPKLDGILDEAVWQRAAVSQPLMQKEPHEGLEASEETSIQVAYTSQSLYFGITCLDTSPDKTVATELRRDGDLAKDDSIWILIDSFHDHRNAFLFATNALGTQYDALISDEGKETNANWDEAWNVAPHRNEQGWSVEIEIPLKALRLRESTSEIGLEFRRIIRRKNEFAYWNTWDRNFQFEEVSRAGHLTGVEKVELGTRYRVKPYGVGGIARSRHGDWDNRSEVGLEDFKWRVTPTLTADFTYNTDFAEVELDSQRSNLINPRNQLFFPEKREFFLEGASFFAFAAQMNENPGDVFRAFFSRRIGLSSDGGRIPVLGGGKLTGRVGGWSIGALNMQTEESGHNPANNFSVVRVRHDLFSRSSLGAIITNRSGEKSDFNRTAGVDARFVLFQNFTLDAFAIGSTTPGVSRDQDAYHLKAFWETDLFDFGVAQLNLGENFNPEMGFLERARTNKRILDVAYKPRPHIKGVRQVILRMFAEEYRSRIYQTLENKVFHYSIDFILEGGDRVRFAPHTRFERVFKPLQLVPGVFVPPGDYPAHTLVFEYTPDPSRRLAGNVQVSKEFGSFGGTKTTMILTPQWKPHSSLIVDLSYTRNGFRLPHTSFVSHVANLTVNYSLNTRLITSTTYQYNNRARVKAFNFRLNYIYRPGDDFFFVYKDVRNELNPEFTERAFLVKFTRSFDF